MSDTTLVEERKSAHRVTIEEPASRSQSVPVLPPPDVVTLYTTPRDGAKSALFLCLYVIRDGLFLTIRVGLSTMMFVMDLMLRLFLFTAEMWLNIPGVFLITSAIRVAMWCVQMILWGIYAALELLFYLPAPLLVVYLLIIGVAYHTMPAALEVLLHCTWWMVEHFLRIVGYMAYPSNKKS